MDAGTEAGIGIDREVAAQDVDAIREADQADARFDPRRVEPDAGVVDRERDLLGLADSRMRTIAVGPACLTAFWSASRQQK